MSAQAQNVNHLETPAFLTEHVLERPGCALHYWLGGSEDRPLLVFLHGATMDHRMFNAQVYALISDYRVLVWDARGHGKSRPMSGSFTLQDCASDLKAILDHHEIRQVVLVGQSMGGYIAQYFYLHYPEAVQAMVIIGSTCIAQPYAQWEVWGLKVSLLVFDWWPFEHFKRIVAQHNAIQPDVREYVTKTIDQIDRRDFLTIWKAVTLAVDGRGIPGHHIRVPLLLTHGDQDNAGTIRKRAPGWAAYEPDVRYGVIPNAGHNANQDNAAFFNGLLQEFLASAVAVRPARG